MFTMSAAEEDSHAPRCYLQAEIHETVLLVKLLPMQVLVEGHRVFHTSLTQWHGHTNHYAVFELLMSCLPLEQWGLCDRVCQVLVCRGRYGFGGGGSSLHSGIEFGRSRTG
jgi:hypothetical protein